MAGQLAEPLSSPHEALADDPGLPRRMGLHGPVCVRVCEVCGGSLLQSPLIYRKGVACILTSLPPAFTFDQI